MNAIIHHRIRLRSTLLLLLLSTILLTDYPTVMAQVGVGNNDPEATAVLDLSNSTNKGLLLPSATSVSAFSSNIRMLYFFDNNIYYHRNVAYNVLSPWKFKFNGNTTNDVYYNLDGNIGIGSSDITVSPLAPLHIELNYNIDLVDDGSFLIGKTLGTNIAFNTNYIQTRDRGSSAQLLINEQGGDVVVGSPAAPARMKSTKNPQQLHQPTGEYHDIISTGVIIMWYGDTGNIPTGWAICDGGNYARSDNNDSILTPDLSGRFVVTVGDNGMNSYSPHQLGGQDAASISINQMPSHNHSGSSNTTGAHTHDLDGDALSYESDNNKDKNGEDGEAAKVDETKSAGSHNHTITIGYKGSDETHENRPTYYALIYIMKL